MIRDARAIAVLALIGISLLFALLRAPTTSTTRVVMPVFEPARSITWGTASLHSNGVTWTGTARLPVDQRYVADLLSSLRSARWHRRDAAAKHAFTRTLVIGGDKTLVTVELGERLAGTDQVWLRVDHGSDALLVDGWLAAFIDPQPIDPYERYPFETAASEPTIGLGQLELQTHPWRDADGLLDPALGDALVAALGRVKLVALGRGLPGRSGVTLGTKTFLVGGTCDGTDLVAFQGAACIDAAAWHDVIAAAAALARGPDPTLDHRPAGFAIDHLERGTDRLALVKRPMLTIAGVVHPADPDLAAELVHALAEPAHLVPVPSGTPQLTLLITPVEGPPVPLDVFATAVHRRGEPLGITISAAQHELFARPLTALVDSERWSEEASTIASLTLDGVTYRRGAVLGEWTREPAGPLDPTLVEILATAAAKLHAPAAAGPVTPSHHLVLHVSPPAGSSVTRELAVGAVSAANRGTCGGLVGAQRVSLPAELCTAVAAVAAH